MSSPLVPEAVRASRLWLARFVEDQAAQTAKRVGFGWRAADDAPDTFEKLCSAFALSVETGGALPVATVNVEPTIFLGASSNWCMRFWHDVTHVELGADFGFAGEQRVACAHLRTLEQAGQGPDSVAWQLLRADTMGQNLVYAMTDGGFVPDQWVFVRDALEFGLPLAVLQVVQDIEDRQIASGDVCRLHRLLEAS